MVIAIGLVLSSSSDVLNSHDSFKAHTHEIRLREWLHFFLSARPSGGYQTSWNQRAHSRITKRRNEKMTSSIVVSFPVVFKTHLVLTVSNVSSMDVVHV